MKTIHVSDDIYEHLRQHADLGEDATSVLRRLLGIHPESLRRSLPATVRVNFPAGSLKDEIRRSVSDVIASRRFAVSRDVVRRFLEILAWVHEQHPNDFSRVLDIRGRKRRYFDTTAEALERTGLSVNPQQIPDTNYWVITNTDTAKKVDMIDRVLRIFDYNGAEINAIQQTLMQG